eukprot:6045978-Prymnesium_polylepis.1
MASTFRIARVRPTNIKRKAKNDYRFENQGGLNERTSECASRDRTRAHGSVRRCVLPAESLGFRSPNVAAPWPKWWTRSFEPGAGLWLRTRVLLGDILGAREVLGVRSSVSGALVDMSWCVRHVSRRRVFRVIFAGSPRGPDAHAAAVGAASVQTRALYGLVLYGSRVASRSRSTVGPSGFTAVYTSRPPHDTPHWGRVASP